MNYNKLDNEITDVVIEALQYFDYADQKGTPKTFEEAKAAIDGAVSRYRNDPIFRAKAQTLVSRITAVVQDNETHDQEITRLREVLARTRNLLESGYFDAAINCIESVLPPPPVEKGKE